MTHFFFGRGFERWASPKLTDFVFNAAVETTDMSNRVENWHGKR